MFGMLPDYVRSDLKKIGYPHTFGVQIDDWAEGPRFKAKDDVIYCKDGEVVSIRRKAAWLWRKETPSRWQ